MKDSYLIITDEKKQFRVHFENEELNGGEVNGNSFKWDCREIKKGIFHVIKNNQSYNIEVLEQDYASKTFTIVVNGNKYKLSAKDKYDELLRELGFDAAAGTKVNDIKAPMPGLVLDVLIKSGDEVKSGDKLIVLEAMKMENILRSPCDGIIKKVFAEKGKAVEKNQVLVSYEL